MRHENTVEDPAPEHPVAKLELIQDDVLRRLDDLNERVIAVLNELTGSRALSEVSTTPSEDALP